MKLQLLTGAAIAVRVVSGESAPTGTAVTPRSFGKAVRTPDTLVIARHGSRGAGPPQIEATRYERFDKSA